MGRIARVEPGVVGRISEHRRIIAFRNQLIHGYDVIDHEIVWRILREKLPVLVSEVTAILVGDDLPDTPSAEGEPSA